MSKNKIKALEATAATQEQVINNLSQRLRKLENDNETANNLLEAMAKQHENNKYRVFDQ